MLGLEKTGSLEAQEMAFNIAKKRVRSSYLIFKANIEHRMYEKYDATSETKEGGGGEYDVQLGFGWTNGVILDFLDMYSNKLSFNEDDDVNTGDIPTWITMRLKFFA